MLFHLCEMCIAVKIKQHHMDNPDADARVGVEFINANVDSNGLIRRLFQLLDIIEQYIISEGYDYSRLDGKTNEVKRVLLVREFNKDRDKFIFLASTKAGGVGLNLTGANIVIIFDPNWNPTHDLQAQDRY